MKLRANKLSWYEFEKERLENGLTKVLGSKFLSEESKEKLRIKYQKKIDEFEFKIKKEKMNAP